MSQLPSENAKAAPAGKSPSAVRSWREMREWSAALLLARTGADVAAWNQRVAAVGPDDERALRAWLAGQGVTGYPQTLLAWERLLKRHHSLVTPVTIW